MPLGDPLPVCYPPPVRIPLPAALLFSTACTPVRVWYGADGSNGGTIPQPPAEFHLVPARVESTVPKACVDPALRDELGPYEVFVKPGPAASTASMWSGGILAGDLDRDGLLDVLAPLEPFARLYQGRAGGPPGDVSGALDQFDLTMGSGGSLADMDGDGDLDILVLRYDRPAVVLRNDGAGAFTDVTAHTGIDASGPTTSSSWGDMDGDGDLDLYIGAYGDLASETPARSYLYENLGEGVFADRSALLRPLIADGFTRVGGFHDLDADGFPELYIVNDVGSVTSNVLLRNHFGTLERDDNASGLDLAMSGGGLGVGDVNGDDVPDLLIPQWGDLSLMLSGDGWWADYAHVLGVEPDASRGQQVGWAAELADLDNDGDLDGLVAYGALEVDLPYWDNETLQPDALFVQQEDGSFEDQASSWCDRVSGICLDDAGKNRGFVVADYNKDGWLDVITRDVDGPSSLYMSRCGADHWMEVYLRDERVANQSAVGARVKVVAGDQSWVRWVNAGGTGYGTGGPPELHFGLGDATHIDRIEVLWPDGETSWVGVGLVTDQRVTIVRD